MLDIDVGILVVSDSADITQKKHYDELKQHCKQVFVVLNKIDLYDKKGLL
jgi:GTPase Era involved in 16S rRNA processing